MVRATRAMVRLRPRPQRCRNQIGATTGATYVPDIQGSIVASLDAASGALTKAGFQPFGESQSTAGTFRYNRRAHRR